MDKDTRKIIREAERQGFEVRTSGKGYPLIYRDGEFIAKAAQTTSDRRSTRNLIATLRRAGFIWPPKK